MCSFLFLVLSLSLSLSPSLALKKCIGRKIIHEGVMSGNDAAGARHALARDGEASGAPMRKKVKCAETAPRLASLDILNMWQNQYVCHSGQGLERWKKPDGFGDSLPPFLVV